MILTLHDSLNAVMVLLTEQINLHGLYPHQQHEFSLSMLMARILDKQRDSLHQAVVLPSFRFLTQDQPVKDRVREFQVAGNACN